MAFGRSVLIDHLGGLAIAFAACFTASWALRLVGASDAATTTASFFLFFVFAFTDPIGAWRGSQSWTHFRLKLAASCVLAVILAMLFGIVEAGRSAVLMFEGLSVNPLSGVETARALLGNAPLIQILPFLVLPVLFMGPAIERILSGTGPEGRRLTGQDVQHALAIPVFVGAQFALIGGIMMGLWSAGVTWPVGLAVVTGGVLAAVADAWKMHTDKAPMPCGPDRGWPEIIDERPIFRCGLIRALRASFPSALFLGGASFTIVAVTVSFGQSGTGPDLSLLGVLSHLAELGTVVLASLLCLSAYAVVVAAAMAFGLALRQGMNAEAIEPVARFALGRMFTGGMPRDGMDADEHPA